MLGAIAALYAADVSPLLAILAVVTPLAAMFGAFILSARRSHRALAPATREHEDEVTSAHGRIALVVVPVMIATLAAPEVGEEAWSLLAIPVVALVVGAARAWRRGDRQTAVSYAGLLLLTSRPSSRWRASAGSRAPGPRPRCPW